MKIEKITRISWGIYVLFWYRYSAALQRDPAVGDVRHQHRRWTPHRRVRAPSRGTMATAKNHRSATHQI